MDQKQIEQFSLWLKFMGILQMIYGVLSCLTIIGALFGVPMFLAGRSLLKASTDIFAYQNYKAPETAEATFSSISKFFKINGIIFAISLVGMIISVLITLFTGAAFLKGFSGGFTGGESSGISTFSSISSPFDNSSSSSNFNFSSTSGFTDSDRSSTQANYSSNSIFNNISSDNSNNVNSINNSQNNNFGNNNSASSINTDNFINGAGASSSRILVPSQSSSKTSSTQTSSDSASYDYRIN